MLPQRPLLGWRREYLPIRQRYSDGPNIKGNSLLAGFVTPSSGEVCGDGPFSGMRRWVQNFTLTSGTNSSVLKFDANLANTLYSDSVTTVRPEAFRALALVRAY